MRVDIGIFAFAVVFALIVGCAPRTATDPNSRVAGTSETATKITATLTEFKITLDPSTVPAGDVIFAVTNNGKTVHALEIEGKGVEQSTRNLDPGEKATLSVSGLTAGTYEIYCPVDNHKGRGMETKLTVK